MSGRAVRWGRLPIPSIEVRRRFAVQAGHPRPCSREFGRAGRRRASVSPSSATATLFALKDTNGVACSAGGQADDERQGCRAETATKPIHWVPPCLVRAMLSLASGPRIMMVASPSPDLASKAEPFPHMCPNLRHVRSRVRSNVPHICPDLRHVHSNVPHILCGFSPCSLECVLHMCAAHLCRTCVPHICAGMSV